MVVVSVYNTAMLIRPSALLQQARHSFLQNKSNRHSKNNRKLLSLHRCLRPSLLPCHAFVGEKSKTAGEYHSQDFNWEICVEEGRVAVERQRQEYRTVHSAKIKENEKISSKVTITSSTHRLETPVSELNTRNTTLGSSALASIKPGNNNKNNQKFNKRERGWEMFHQQHAAARFFKEKRYIPLEFPALMETKEGGSSSTQGLRVAEIGCGCGSALLPVLKANSSARATACDLSPTAIELLKIAAEREGISLDRINAFAYDASKESGHKATTKEADEASFGPLAGLDADCCLMIFTLSALWPKDMLCMLRHAYYALRPGGLLLFRDYGLYDMAQIRFPGSQLIDPEDLVYQRLDGTLSSFFSTERMDQLARSAGFQVLECEYVTNLVRNRKKGTEMKRVFVHGVFEKIV